LRKAITCLRAPAIQALAADGGPLQLLLFDERDLAKIEAGAEVLGELRLVEQEEPVVRRQDRRAALGIFCWLDVSMEETHICIVDRLCERGRGVPRAADKRIVHELFASHRANPISFRLLPLPHA
jgi:hypothetical protein